jgi:tetratricopeptide (TPR) repeat protein
MSHARESKGWPKWALPGLLMLGLAAQGLSLVNGFTNWDDPALVTQNPRVQSFDLAAMLRPVPGLSYQPIRELSHAIDVAIWGDIAFGHHAVNLLLHLAATLLLAQLVATLLRACERHDEALPLALVVAGLFAVHPVNVESVAWISSRKYGLAAVGIFGCCLAHLCGHRRSALAAALFTMLSSPFGIVLPGLIVLLDLTRYGKSAREHWRSWLPIAISALLMCLLMRSTLLAADSLARIDTVRAGPATIARSLFDILQHLALPLNLGVRYLSRAANVADWRVYAGLLLLVAACLLAWRRKDRVLTAGLLWFAICWAPVSGIVPISTFVADRYSYLSGVGIFLALATLVNVARWRWGFLGLLLVLTALSMARCRIWRDSESLWRAEIARQPNHEIARYNLALALLEQGNVEEAEQQLRRAIEVRPSYLPPYLVLGKQLGGQAGLELLREATTRAPEHALAAAAYGESLLDIQAYTEACAQLERALTIDPNQRDAMSLLARGYLRLGRFQHALQLIDHALALEPDAPHLQIGKGLVLAEAGRPQEAVAWLRRSSADPGAVLQMLRRNARLAFGDRPASAISALQTATLLAPDDDDLYGELASAQYQAGQISAAIVSQQRAVSLAPESPEHFANLGGMLATDKQFDAARDVLERALALDPQNEKARGNLEQLRRDTRSDSFSTD